MEKRCCECKEVKDLSEFSKNKNSTDKDKHNSMCKSCVSMYGKKRRINNIKLKNSKEYKPITEKTCIKCNKLKNVIEFYKDKGLKDGFKNVCKACEKKRRIDRFKEFRKNRIETTIEKKCPSCGEIKKLIEFHKNKYQRDGWQGVCKKCRHKYYVEKGYIRVSEYGKERYAKADKKVWHEANKKNYIKNKKQRDLQMKKYREKNKEKLALQQKEYRNSNAKYKLYHNRLTVDEAPRIHEDGESLEVLCKYCGKYFVPLNGEVTKRIEAINGTSQGILYLYCNNECKNNCPIYGQIKYPKGFKKGTSREVDPFIRQLCFERDNWTCQKCGVTENLHCHHIDGYAQNKILANDIDNVITLCKSCHKEVHLEVGCRYTDLRCG